MEHGRLYVHPRVLSVHVTLGMYCLFVFPRSHHMSPPTASYSTHRRARLAAQRVGRTLRNAHLCHPRHDLAGADGARRGEGRGEDSVLHVLLSACHRVRFNPRREPDQSERRLRYGLQARSEGEQRELVSRDVFYLVGSTRLGAQQGRLLVE